MLPLLLTFPNIDPIAFSIGPLSVKWYGLAYAAGLLLGWLYVKRLLLDMRLWPTGGAPFSTDKSDDLLLYMTLGVVLGGRLGYVLFYKPAYFLANPADIVAVWSGGMSFHGGFLGSVAAILLFAWQNRVNPLSVFDLAAASALADPATDLAHPLMGPFAARDVANVAACAAALELARDAGPVRTSSSFVDHSPRPSARTKAWVSRYRWCSRSSSSDRA